MCLAIPGRILSIENDAQAAPGDAALMRQGRVAFAGIVKRANLAYVPEAAVGDYVLVHAGVAIALVDEREAQRTLADLAELDPGELA